MKRYPRYRVSLFVFQTRLPRRDIMKRCSICDSTEQHDVLKDAGLSEPITNWFSDPVYGDTCNRCHTSSQECLSEMMLEDEND